MRPRILAGLAAVLLVGASCNEDPVARPLALTQAAATLASLRASFPRASLGAAGVPRALHVEVPDDARGELLVEDPASRVGARIALEGARSSPRADADGIAVYRDANVVVRTTESGVEDHVLFAEKPSREEARYVLTPAEGTRLRLVANVLELVDARGAPRVRMNAPWVESARRERVEATATLEGCAFDADPAPPWGRALPLPGPGPCTLIIRWTDVSYPALLDPNWTTTGSMGFARYDHTTVKLKDGRVLLIFGQRCLMRNSCDATLTPTGEIYDPATRTFATTGAAADRTARAPGVLLGNDLSLVLGPASVGGQLYSPVTGRFTPAGASTIGRSSGATLTLLADGKVLAAGGATSARVEVYDPVANTFTLGPALKTNRSGHTATLLADGKVLLAGGGTDTAELYDPVASTTTLTGSMAFSRTEHAAARLTNGKVLVVSGAETATTELYDPVAGTFAPTGSLANARLDLGAVVLASGNVYTVGGYFPTATNPLSSVVVERYDPAAGTFDYAPFLLRGRHRHRVTLLDDGSLLATGGLDSTRAPDSTTDAELLGLAPPGGSCARGDDCATGICDFGVCCAVACTGSCRSCAAGTGVCATVTSADDPSSCTGRSTCDAAGECKKKVGETCSATGECASGACVDSVCCDGPCNGPCEACNGAVPGRCDVVAGSPRGGRSCPSDGTVCAGACDGTVRDRCAFAGETTGCGTTCEGSSLTASACDSKGACSTKTRRPCAGNFTCADGESCRTRCAKDDECARSFGCTPEGTCTPIAACDGDRTILAADGKSKTDCTPYRCDLDTNRCRTSCADVSGCVAPFVCDFDGRCVAPPKAAASCAAGSARGTSAGSSARLGFGLALALALAAARRRRPLW